jgi:hypothetical protein
MRVTMRDALGSKDLGASRDDASPTLGPVRSLRSIYGGISRRLSPSGRRARDVGSVLADPALSKYDLGGLGKGGDGWTTVNLVDGVDIEHDICDLDGFCADRSVDVFLLRHTLEHIPLPVLHPFLEGTRRKLRGGGRLVVIQTDGRKVLAMHQRRRLDFYATRDVLFSPMVRRTQGIEDTHGHDLMGHQYMWGAEDLARELRFLGFSAVATFDAGTWPFDIPSAMPFQSNERFFGRRIPNLGVVAVN